MKGGHAQPANSGPPGSVRDQAGVAERTAAAPTAATWLRISVMSFTRTKNPAWHRASNDHQGKGETKRHPQKRLKMGTIEVASAFFRGGTGKAFEFHPAGSKASQRNDEADDAGDMQHVVMTGGATMLFEHVAQTQVDAPCPKTRDQAPPESQWC